MIYKRFELGEAYNLLSLNEKKLGFKVFITNMIFYGIPLLWFFKVLNAKHTLYLLVTVIILLSFIFSSNKNEEDNKI